MPLCGIDGMLLMFALLLSLLTGEEVVAAQPIWRTGNFVCNCSASQKDTCIGSGHDAGKLQGVPTADVCCANCSAVSGCISWTWLPPSLAVDEYNCWLKTNADPNPVPCSPGATSGSCAPAPGPVAVNLTIATDMPLRELPHAFLGVNLDWWPPTAKEPWGNASVLLLDLQNQRLNKLAAAIAPGTLRIGGSLDKVVQYLVDGETEAACNSSLCLNMTRWAQVVDFAIRIGAKITWGLSYPVAAGTEETWNGTNPTAFLAHIAGNATQSQVIQGGIELGEEIDPHEGEGPAFQQYADSWPVFASARDKLWPSNPPQTYGPCPGMPSFDNVSDFWIPMLNQTAHQRTMDVVVFHSYNNPSSWPWLLDLTLQQARTLVPLVAAIDTAAGLPQPRRVVLGEGGPHNGGGIMGVTNTFASSSYYMDALGLLPVVGVTGFNRQALVGGDYELLNRTTFLPNPDYWVAYGYRLLVGPKVLTTFALAPTDPVLNASLRVYAHCAQTADPNRASKGDVVIFWSSADISREYDLRLSGLPALDGVDVYALTPHEEIAATGPANVFTKLVDLNGQLLALGPDDSLPSWAPASLPAGAAQIRVPPAAVGWAVLRGAAADACM